MSGSQKALKIISIILIVWAIILLVFGALLTGGSQLPGMSAETIDVQGTAIDMSSMSLIMGIGMIVSGVMYLIISLLGLRGAKNPAKIGAFFVLCIIGLVLNVLSLISLIAQGQFNWTYLVSVALIVVCTYLAFQIKKQA